MSRRALLGHLTWSWYWPAAYPASSWSTAWRAAWPADSGRPCLPLPSKAPAAPSPSRSWPAHRWSYAPDGSSPAARSG